MSGKEAVITRVPGAVVKTFKPFYFELNELHGRPPEEHWYRVRPIRDMPRLITSSREALVLEDCGRRIGGDRYEVKPRHRTAALRRWLLRLLHDLVRAGVHHGDIKAQHVLYARGRFTLIDWTWASTTGRSYDLYPGDAEAVRLLIEAAS